MSVSRILLAGLACASLGLAQAAPTVARAQGAARNDNPNGDTKGRLAHASKCVLTFGFGGGCDGSAPAKAKAEDRAAATRSPKRPSTRSRLARASKCVVSLGFVGDCDKDTPDGSATAAAAARRADAAPREPDTSTRGRLVRAVKCVGSLGLAGGECDRGDIH